MRRAVCTASMCAAELGGLPLKPDTAKAVHSMARI